MGEGGRLKIGARFHLDDVDRKHWHIATARHLRFFADQIEAKGLNCPGGNIVNGFFPFETIVNQQQEYGRCIFEYTER
jgi:hypothetical protein